MTTQASLLSPVPDVASHGKRRPLHALTSIRFFAAMYVVLFHCDAKNLFPSISLWHNFFASGYTGVTLFFSLSGFILAYNYVDITDRYSFWTARFARVYPAYLVSILISLVYLLHAPQHPTPAQMFPRLLTTLLLVQAWYPPWAMALNSVAWTLSVEAFFYLVFPWVLGFSRRASRGQIALFAAVYLGWVLAPLVLPRTGAVGDFASRIAIATDGTIPLFRLGTFIIGVLAGVYFHRRPQSPRWLLPASVILTFLLLVWNPDTFARPLKTLLLSCAYSGLLFALAVTDFAFLRNRWLLLGGEISYSIYLLQFIVFHSTGVVLIRGLHMNLQPSTIVFLAIIPLILVSFCNFHWIEIPARRLLRKWLLPDRTPAAAGS